MRRGKLITLEGIEGVGKSTQLEFMREVLQTLGIPHVVITRETGGTPIAEAIRHVLLSHHEEPMSSDAELLLTFASRAQHIFTLINPSLERGEWVICDRYVDATYAYQGAGRGLSFDRIEMLDKWICHDCEPNLTLLFDAPVPLALSRIKNRSKADRFETEEAGFFQRIRDYYLARAKTFPNRFRLVDASFSPESVQEQIHFILREFVETQQ